MDAEHAFVVAATVVAANERVRAEGRKAAVGVAQRCRRARGRSGEEEEELSVYRWGVAASTTSVKPMSESVPSMRVEQVAIRGSCGPWP